jgi:hypothetical protein
MTREQQMQKRLEENQKHFNQKRLLARNLIEEIVGSGHNFPEEVNEKLDRLRHTLKEVGHGYSIPNGVVRNINLEFAQQNKSK